MAPKKIDRRIIYTKYAIKESFLQIKAVKDYNTITITDICRKAEISRSTFYLHYGNVSEVLDELIDDLMANVSGLMEHLLHEPQKEGSAQCTWPMCQFLRMNQKYHCIFFDDALSSRIINRIIAFHLEDFIHHMENRSDLSREEIEALAYFQMNGCFAVSKRFAKTKDSLWCPMQNVIDTFIDGGLKAFSRQ